MTLPVYAEEVAFGNGVVTAFDFSFRTTAAANVDVFVEDTLTGIVTQLPTNEYSVAGVGDDDGGTVTILGDPLLATDKVIITSGADYFQGIDIINQSGFYPSVVESGLDRLARQVQQVATEVARSIRGGPGEAWDRLTGPFERANTFLSFGDDGEPELAVLAPSSPPATGDIASQAEAEAGVNNTKIMTPLRVKQAIAALLAATMLTPTGSDYALALADLVAERSLIKFYGVVNDGSNADADRIIAAFDDALKNGHHLIVDDVEGGIDLAKPISLEIAGSVLGSVTGAGPTVSYFNVLYTVGECLKINQTANGERRIVLKDFGFNITVENHSNRIVYTRATPQGNPPDYSQVVQDSVQIFNDNADDFYSNWEIVCHNWNRPQIINFRAGGPSFNVPLWDNAETVVLAARRRHEHLGDATVTIASPGVVSKTAHGLSNGQRVKFSTTGALPTGLVAGTGYYVINKAANTLQLSATSGGAAINTSGTQSGVHTLSMFNTTALYQSTIAHTSSSSFITDFNAGNWTLRATAAEYHDDNFRKKGTVVFWNCYGPQWINCSQTPGGRVGMLHGHDAGQSPEGLYLDKAGFSGVDVGYLRSCNDSEPGFEMRSCNFNARSAGLQARPQHPYTITGITKDAAGGVLTVVGHPFTEGMTLFTRDITGMVEMNSLRVEVIDVIDVDHVRVDEDTSGFTVYGSGGEAWVTGYEFYETPLFTATTDEGGNRFGSAHDLAIYISGDIDRTDGLHGSVIPADILLMGEATYEMRFSDNLHAGAGPDFLSTYRRLLHYERTADGDNGIVFNNNTWTCDAKYGVYAPNQHAGGIVAVGNKVEAAVLCPFRIGADHFYSEDAFNAHKARTKNVTAVGNVGGGADLLMPNIAVHLNAVNAGIRYLASGTIANNSNPKTLTVHLGATIILTHAFAVSIAGTWDLEITAISKGVDSQFYKGRLLTNGAAGVAINVPVQGTLTEDSGTAEVPITMNIRCLGTVTDGGGGINNNDIVQTFSMVENV